MKVLSGSGLVMVLAGLLIGSAVPAPADDFHRERNRTVWAGDRDDARAYQKGLRDGMQDRQKRNRQRSSPWARGNDRDAYQAGYQAGLYGGNNSGARYGYPGNRGSYGYGTPGNTSPRYGSPIFSRGTASQFGYQDGYQDGLRDAQRGNTFRPTSAKNFKSGTHGYSATLGSKDYYKQSYRQAYTSGYQSGYRVR